MASEGFVHRLPPPSGAAPSQPSSTAAPSVQQESGSVAPPQPSLFPRSLFYMHAPPPPPPPLFHYQWPMPYYSPFMGFPGSGYGMVMPPFLPPTYSEPSAYVLPHLQPVDYRRLHHPPVNAPVPCQQPLNQPRRSHPLVVRETVSIEVQTEPTRAGGGSAGFDDGCFDSGHGTASSTPSSSSSSSKKQDSEEVKGYSVHCSTTESSQIPEQPPSHAVQAFMNVVQTKQRRRNAAGQEPPPVLAHFNMWSEGSTDGIVPVLSSSQREEAEVKERRLSVPDVIMVKITENELPENEPSLCNMGAEHEASVFRSPEVNHGSVMEEILRSQDEDMLYKILRLPFSLEMFRRDSRSFCCHPDELLLSQDETHTTLNEDTAELSLYRTSSLKRRVKRKVNESVWSVESLEPYIPSQGWLLQNGFLEQQVIMEAEGDAFPATETCEDVQQGCWVCPSDSMTTNRHDVSPPAGKWCSPKKKVNGSDGDQGVKGNNVQDDEDGLIHLQDKTSTPALEEIKETCTSEVTGIQNEQENSPRSPRERTPSTGEDKTPPQGFGNTQRAADSEEEGDVLPLEKRGPPAAPRKLTKEAEPLKLMDCAVQCSDLCRCTSQGNGVGPEWTPQTSVPRKILGSPPNLCCDKGRVPKNGRKTEIFKTRNQEKPNQANVGGHVGKVGRAKGGNGRNRQ